MRRRLIRIELVHMAGLRSSKRTQKHVFFILKRTTRLKNRQTFDQKQTKNIILNWSEAQRHGRKIDYGCAHSFHCVARRKNGLNSIKKILLLRNMYLPKVFQLSRSLMLLLVPSFSLVSSSSC